MMMLPSYLSKNVFVNSGPRFSQENVQKVDSLMIKGRINFK